MQTNNKKCFRFAMLFSLIALLGISFTFSACNDDEDSDEVILKSFGPSPIPLGGQVTFIGENLDKISSIVFPGDYEITSFEEQTSKRIIVKAPSDSTYAYAGYVTLKYGDKTLRTLTKIGYKQSAQILTLEPSEVKPGKTLTITGNYLSVVTKVVLSDGITIEQEDFESQTNGAITLTVPATAQSGTVQIYDGSEYIYSDGELKVTLPTFTSFSKTENVYPGKDEITISGTDLDVVRQVVFEGAVVDVEPSSEESLTVQVPIEAKDGNVSIVVASGIEIDTKQSITVVKPSITQSPESALLGEEIEIEGDNLDLITKVTLGGADVTDFKYTDGKITLAVPETAKNGLIMSTANDDEVSAVLQIISFTIIEDSENQINANAGSENTIKGTNLKYVSSLSFNGINATDLQPNADGTELTFKLVPQACTEASGQWTQDGFSAVATNGEELNKNLWLNGFSTPYLLAIPATSSKAVPILVTGVSLQDVDKVTIGEEEVDFAVLSDKKMYITLPNIEGKYNIVLYKGSESSSSLTEIEIIGSEPVSIWKGSQNIGTAWSWDDRLEFKYDGTVVKGTKIIFKFEQNADAEYCQIKADAFKTSYAADDNGWGCVDVGGKTEYVIILDAESAAAFNGTFTFTGYGLTYKEILIQ